MLRSNRGAARVSAVWMISVGVVALAAFAFAFISQSDLQGEVNRRENAVAEKVAAEDAMNAASEQRRNVSQVLGWYDRESADPAADPEAATSYLAGLRQTFSDLTDTDADFETALPKIVTAYDQRVSEIAGLETQIQSLRAQADAANAAVTQVEQAKDQVIADLRSQISDEQENSAERQKELEDRIASLQQRLSDKDEEARDLRTEMADQQREAAKAARLAAARIINLQDLLVFTQGDARREADGEILDVSASLPLAWINLGANQRVSKGMRFEVMGGTPGNEYLKAWAEVTKVHANRAEVAIQDMVDRWDPVARGDKIVNELYSPEGTRNAVLAGSFQGRWSRSELVSLLGNMGVRVQDDVDYATHYMIVGAAFYNDPESGDPLDEPLSPTETEVYKKAMEYRVQVVPLDRIRELIRATP